MNPGGSVQFPRLPKSFRYGYFSLPENLGENSELETNSRTVVVQFFTAVNFFCSKLLISSGQGSWRNRTDKKRLLLFFSGSVRFGGGSGGVEVTQVLDDDDDDEAHKQTKQMSKTETETEKDAGVLLFFVQGGLLRQDTREKSLVSALMEFFVQAEVDVGIGLRS